MGAKEPVRGMRDILPREMEIREAVLAKLTSIYGSFGFSRIETPCMERIENLSSKQGGENEKLVFKILKRGEKLASAFESGNLDDLVDSGLRYDLTVPLSRYYANNAADLPKPFKAMQIGSVWRADRPQKGRYRQFTQCDIDILGDSSSNAEVELILATSCFLKEMGIEGCKVIINDRRILRALVASCGFSEESYDEVLVSLDKYDKIGLDGVCGELENLGYSAACIEEYRSLFKGFLESDDRIGFCEEKLSVRLEEGVIENMRSIIESVAFISEGEFTPQLEISLVRGMGYYTGPIFEVVSEEFPGSSIAGGGRYDKMIGRFIGQDVEACGFSIGFERIIAILLDREDDSRIAGKTALLYGKRLSSLSIAKLQKAALAMRADGSVVALCKMNRNVKHQKEQMESEGYRQFLMFDDDESVDSFVSDSGR